MDCALYAEPPCCVDGKSLPGEWVFLGWVLCIFPRFWRGLPPKLGHVYKGKAAREKAHAGGFHHETDNNTGRLLGTITANKGKCLRYQTTRCR